MKFITTKRSWFSLKKKPLFSCAVKSGKAPKEPLPENEEEAWARRYSTVQKPSKENEEGERKA